MTQPVQLIVLAGGFGSRLRSAVPDVPKPLAPVLGRPYLEYVMQSWFEQGVVSMTFLLHYQAPLVESFVTSVRERFAGCALRTLTERTPLGTGGSIANAVRELDIEGAFLVANADTWLGTGIQATAATAAPAMALVEAADIGRYGGVGVRDGKIVSFGEKAGVGTGWINAGLYHLHADMFEDWGGGAFSIESTVFPVLAEQKRLNAVQLATTFIDIGIPEDYARFGRWIASGRSDSL